MAFDMRASLGLGVVLVFASFAPAVVVAQPIQPAPPVVQPTPVVPPAPYVQPAPYAPQPILQPPLDPEAASGRRTLMTGVVLTSISHGAAWTLAVALGPADPVAWWLALPLGGPAIWGALWGCDGEDPHGRDVCRALLATGGGFWAALQLAGMVTMITGIAKAPKRSGPRLALGPLTVGDAKGLAVWGSF